MMALLRKDLDLLRGVFHVIFDQMRGTVSDRR